MVNGSEFQRGRKEEPHGEKNQESNKAPSHACSACWTLPAPRFWVKISPFSVAMGMVPAGKEEQEAVSVLFCKLQWEKQSRSPSGLSSWHFGREVFQVTPWWKLVPSGLLLPGFSILCGLHSTLWLLLAVVGFGQCSKPLRSASSFSQLCHNRLSWPWLPTLLFCVRCPFISPPPSSRTHSTPISATIPPYFKQLWRISFGNKLTTKIRRGKKKKRKEKNHISDILKHFGLVFL